MIRFLTLILSLIERLFNEWDRMKLRQEGRQQAIKEAEDEVQRQVELAEHVGAVVDPEYDKRVRARFDAAARSE